MAVVLVVVLPTVSPTRVGFALDHNNVVSEVNQGLSTQLRKSLLLRDEDDPQCLEEGPNCKQDYFTHLLNLLRSTFLLGFFWYY